MKNQIDMTEGPVLAKLVRFSIPLILSSCLQLLFNAADIIVVGRYAGDNALAAVGSVAPLVNLLVNFFMGLSVGCNVVAANFFGGGRKDDVNRTVHTAMLLSIFGGILLTFVGVFLSVQLLQLMGAPETVLPLSTIYLRVFFGGITATVVYNFGSALLRAKGDTKRPLYVLFVAGIINVILNLVFVILFEMSVAGVAFATVLSQCFSAVCVVVLLLKEEEEFRLNVKKLKIHWDILKRIVRIGLPAGLQGMIFSFSNVLIQSSVNSFGAVVVAGNSACQSIEGFIYTSMNGFAQGTLTFVSQNMGAHKIDRIKKVIKISLSCVTVIGLVMGFGAVLFGKQLFSIFTREEKVIQAAILRMSVIGSTYCLCGVMDCCANSIRGMGYSMTPMLITLFGACGLRIIYLATVFQVERFHTYQSIFVSYPLSWGITFVALLAFIIVAIRNMERKAAS